MASVENDTFSPVAERSLDFAARTLTSAGLADSSKVAYQHDRACWTTFMQQRGRPPLPVTAEDLCEYVVLLLTVGSPAVPLPRPLAASTIERRMAALCTWSRQNGLPRPDLFAARHALRGHRRTHGSRSPARAAPLTVDGLRAVLTLVERDAAAGHPARALRNKALLLVSFAIAARRSEAVGLDVTDVVVTPEGMLVTVLRAKTRTTPDTVAVPYGQDCQLCPVRATVELRQYLAARGVTDGALFRRITATDRVLPYRLRPAAVAQIIAGLAAAAQLPVPDGFRGFSGHSVRRGMASESRRAGADALAVARQGGWQDGSSSLAVYLADVDQWSGHALKGVL